MKTRNMIGWMWLVLAVGLVTAAPAHAFYNPQTGLGLSNCLPAFDGNGNVAALINAADGSVAANYEYAAFGEPIRITGAMARNNPFRFSTKYADDESDLLYYGYRYYKPSTGTWPNRDPLADYAIFKNSIHSLTKKQVKQFKIESLMPTYGFVRNDPTQKFDVDGQFCPCISIKYWWADGAPIFVWQVLEIARQSELHGNGDIRHCIAACLLKRHFNSLVRRVWDWKEENDSDDSQGDKHAEDVGETLACKDGTCEQSCHASFPNPR